jgi:2-polyprenyl-3-methyl-5-hydroxy-6-metoxy-1,4-benzoquinol methylase
MQNLTHDTRFWDRTARTYAADPIKDMAGYERTLARTRSLLLPTDTVLELGCGTGTTALPLATSVSAIVGTDLSTEMVTIAREKAAAGGCQNAEFVVAPADRAALGGRSFDAVLAFSVLHLLADRQATYRHITSVLKPGGLFISKTPCLTELNPFIRMAVPVARLVGQAPFVSFFSAAALERDIADAGFEIVERARHGTTAKDMRVFIVAKKAGG